MCFKFSIPFWNDICPSVVPAILGFVKIVAQLYETPYDLRSRIFQHGKSGHRLTLAQAHFPLGFT